MCPASCVRHCGACVDLPPSVDRGEASVGVSAFLVPLGIDNAADGGFARPAPAPTKAISVGVGKFCSNVAGLRSASLTRRMAASHVQLRLPRRRYPLERDRSARTSLGFARRRNAADSGFARPAPAPTKAISVGTGKFGSNVVAMAASHFHFGSCEGDICWLWESPARTSLGSLGVVNAADCGVHV